MHNAAGFCRAHRALWAPAELRIAAVCSSIPFKIFDQADQPVRLFRFHIDNQIDALFHVRANVADLPRGINGIPDLWINLALQFGDFVKQSVLLDVPEISDQPLKATAGQSG